MKFIGILFLLFMTWHVTTAQTSSIDTSSKKPLFQLPELAISTLDAENTLTWVCQYNGVKSISIQRSSDSVRNYTTIGVLNAPKKGEGSYKDMHPMVGKNYYRLSVEFGSDLEWFSNTSKIIIDSVSFAKAIEERNKINSIKPTVVTTSSTKKSKIVTDVAETTTGIKNDSLKKTAPIAPPPFSFTPSQRIFTNPYTGHININLEDVFSHRYTIRFYDPSKNEVLRISRVTKTFLILDKNNFNSRGIYGFTLFDGSKVVEEGFVTIY